MAGSKSVLLGLLYRVITPNSSWVLGLTTVAIKGNLLLVCWSDGGGGLRSTSLEPQTSFGKSL